MWSYIIEKWGPRGGSKYYAGKDTPGIPGSPYWVRNKNKAKIYSSYIEAQTAASSDPSAFIVNVFVKRK